MIRNETEYKQAVERLSAERKRLAEQRKRLEATGLSAAERKRVLDPLVSFHEQLVEEVESYERLVRGDLGEVENLHGIGRMLIGLRIARGMSQRDLAERLGVHESQVSRDERNEYHGATIERVSRLLDVLGATARTRIDTPLPELPPATETRVSD